MKNIILKNSCIFAIILMSCASNIIFCSCENDISDVGHSQVLFDEKKEVKCEAKESSRENFSIINDKTPILEGKILPQENVNLSNKSDKSDKSEVIKSKNKKFDSVAKKISLHAAASRRSKVNVDHYLKIKEPLFKKLIRIIIREIGYDEYIDDVLSFWERNKRRIKHGAITIGVIYLMNKLIIYPWVWPRISRLIWGEQKQPSARNLLISDDDVTQIGKLGGESAGKGFTNVSIAGYRDWWLKGGGSEEFANKTCNDFATKIPEALYSSAKNISILKLLYKTFVWTPVQDAIELPLTGMRKPNRYYP